VNDPVQKPSLHHTLFYCRIGSLTRAEPAGRLLETLVASNCRLETSEGIGARIISWKIVRRGFEIEHEGELTEEQRLSLERLCIDYDAAVA
jgi:hypothetical protein